MAAEAAVITRRRLLCAAAASALLAAPAWARDEPARKLKAVATISVLGDLVQNVGGDRIEAATLVGANGDAHVYSPTPGDTRTLATADIVFVNGLGLEGWMTRLVAASGTKAPTVVATKGIAPREIDDGRAHGRAELDPHAWQSVANAKIYVANIRDGLASVDPAHRALYEANALAYLAKLDDLEKEVIAAIAGIPPERRKIITTHAAFGYFGDAYGVQIIAPEGLSTDAEPSAKELAGIIAQIRRLKIPAVFLENVTDPRLIEEIARETGAAIGGALYSDALSEPGGPAPTYIAMMRHNVREMTKALAR